MKDFLETLELGDSKYKLSKEEIKSILAEHGKSVKVENEKVENNYKSEIEDYKNTIQELKGQIDKLPKTDELESLKTQIADYEKKEQDRIAEEQDKMLTNNILEVFGDRKFTSDYAKNGLIKDIKEQLGKQENKGKGIKDIFESLTKDQEGIFVNPQKLPNMAKMSDKVSTTSISKEDFDKMGYQERLNLKNENPELFRSYNEE